LEHVRVMSALPPKADIAESDWHVRFVPKADICSAARIVIRLPRPRGREVLLEPRGQGILRF
jgi:hypothetical protein